MSYNVSFSIASIFIVAILILIVTLNYSSTNLINKRYRLFLISTVVMFALNIVTAYTNEHASTVPVWANLLLNTIYFFSGAVVAVLFLYYSLSISLINKRPRYRKALYIINISILSVYLVTLIINCFTGFYFNFDNSEYTHGSLYYAVNAIAVLFLIESLVFFIIKRKSFNLKQRISTIVFYASFFTSFFLQLFVFKNILLSDFGTALGALIVFFTLETPDYAKLMATLNELNELKSSLEIQVATRTRELDEEKQSYGELTLETLSSLAEMIDAKDHYTNGHSFRVAAYAKGMAKLMNFSSRDVEQIYFAGLIHDVGKVGINESILTKPGKLTPSEYAIIQSHSLLGGNILKGIKQFKIFEEVARSHHERFDGTGYPDKLKGDDIPFAARIVAVCDTFDAMTSDRSYRKALKDEVAINELINVKGTQLDPNCVDIFIELYNFFSDSIRNHIDELKS